MSNTAFSPCISVKAWNNFNALLGVCVCPLKIDKRHDLSLQVNKIEVAFRLDFVSKSPTEVAFIHIVPYRSRCSDLSSKAWQGSHWFDLCVQKSNKCRFGTELSSKPDCVRFWSDYASKRSMLLFRFVLKSPIQITFVLDFAP